MADHEGFDDQFNDKIFVASHHNTSHLRRPKVWPSSVSKMRGNTSYETQGMQDGHDTRHVGFRVRMPPPARPPPKWEWHYSHGLRQWVQVRVN